MLIGAPEPRKINTSMKSSALYLNLPPSGEDYEPADFTSRDGAAALKEKIEAYWAERGMRVMLTLQNVGFHPAIRAARYDVRSDMINGLPRATAVKAPLPDGVGCDADDLDVDDVFLD